MIYSRRIDAGVSACVYGCKVRYNGKGWNLIERMGREREMFAFHVFCPEVMAGLGIPRNPIRLVGGNGEAFWNGDAQILQQGAGKRTLELRQSVDFVMDVIKRKQIRVFFYMEGSPTCGVVRTTNRNRRVGKPPGILGQRLLEEEVFLIPAQDLQSPLKWWDWRRRMLAFLWLEDQEVDDMAKMYAVWNTVKFLCQELDEPRARALGKDLAACTDVEMWSDYRRIILDILRQPSTSEKIRQWLWKNYSHYRKKYGIKIAGIQDPTSIKGATRIAQEMLLLELEMHKRGWSFGSSPVIFRRERS